MNSKIGNVTLNYEFYGAEDPCAGNDIYNRLLEIVKSDKDIEEILLDETDGEMLYHLSDIRKNLLSSLRRTSLPCFFTRRKKIPRFREDSSIKTVMITSQAGIP